MVGVQRGQAKILDELCELTWWHWGRAREVFREARGPPRVPEPREARPPTADRRPPTTDRRRGCGETLHLVAAVSDAPARERMTRFLRQMAARLRRRPHSTDPFSSQAIWGPTGMA